MKKVFLFVLAIIMLMGCINVEAATQGRYVYYLSSDGSTDYTVSDLENLIKKIQKKLPSKMVVKSDNKFSKSMDKLRENRQKDIVADIGINYPRYAEELAVKEKCQLTKGILRENLDGYLYDGALVVTVTPKEIPGERKPGVEIGLKIYDIHSDDYVYEKNLIFDEKIGEKWSASDATKRLLPKLLDEIERIRIR